MTVLENVPSDSLNLECGRNELSVLLDRRASTYNELMVHRATGDLENNDPYHRAREALQSIDRRISDLRSSSVDTAAADDGTARTGSHVSVMFDRDEDDVETFVLVDSGASSDIDKAQTCSPASPLGEALMGCRVGDTRTYSLPTGSECTVTVLAVNPGR